MRNQNFKLKGCKLCGGNNPYCPECNDMGGFNENDNYISIASEKPIIKAQLKSPSKPSQSRKTNDCSIQRKYEEALLKDKEYDKLIKECKKKKAMIRLKENIEIRINYWKKFHDQEFSIMIKQKVKTHIDYLTAYVRQLNGRINIKI